MRTCALVVLAMQCGFWLGCGDDSASPGAAGAGGEGGDAVAGTSGSGGDGGGGGSSGAAGDDNPTDGTCNEPSPSDAFTGDAIAASGSKVSCYYAPPVGYCRQLMDPTLAGQASSDGKGAIGCGDAIVRTDEDCPTDTAIGKCEGISGSAVSETRYYYPCNQYDSNPTLMSPEYSCMQLGGTYSAL